MDIFFNSFISIFPDDLLCIIAGSVKFNFATYTIFNLIGRTIGLVTMCLVLQFIKMSASSFPIMIIVWAIALIVEIITILIIKRR